MSKDGEGPQLPAPGIDPAVLWSVPLPEGGGGLLTKEPGGCVVYQRNAVLAYSSNGHRLWEWPTEGDGRGEAVIAPDGVLIHIEGKSVVTRTLETGEAIGSFPAPPMGSDLSIAPWGDLLYSQAAPNGVAAVHCVARYGQHRWSVSLDGSSGLVYEPFAVGDVVLVERRGAVWAFDRAGDTPWIVDSGGIRHPRPEDDIPRPAEGPEAGISLGDEPALVDSGRVLLELATYSDSGLYLLDVVAASLTPVAVPSPALPPFAVVPWPPTEYRIVGRGAQVEVAQMQWEYPLLAIDPGGARAWEHRLPARAQALIPAPGGNLLVSLSPDPKRWRDYQQWYDLSSETFVRCLGSDGTIRWTWYAPGPLTHFPVASSSGTVYVGCEERLWALSTAVGGADGA